MSKNKRSVQIRWFVLVFLGLGALPILALIFTQPADAAPHTQSTSCEWQIVSSPSTVSPFNNRLEDVVAISPTDAWAVGMGDGDILIQRWDGTQWSIFPAPAIPNLSTQANVVNSRLHSIDAFAADDIWAVGTYIDATTDRSRPLAIHYDGVQWNFVPTPNRLDTFNAPQITALNGVSVISSNDVWAVGGEARSLSDLRFIDEPGILMHWDGIEWTTAFPPANTGFGATMFDVTSTDSNNVMAVGPRPPRSYQFDGSQWAEEPSILGNNYISIDAINAQNVIAVGTQPRFIGSSGSNFPERPLARLFDGSSWIATQPASAPGGGDQGLRAVSAVSPTEFWAVGYAQDFTMIQHWNGSQWNIVASPNGNPVEDRNRVDVNRLLGIDMLSTTDGWAVGYFRNEAGNQLTLILRYNCGNGGNPTPVPTATQPPVSTPTPSPTPAPQSAELFVSSTTGGNIDGVSFRDEDILKYDGSTWSLYFDGSDVGIGGADINAFTMLDDGSLLISLDKSFTVNGISADDSDILRFEPTSLGSNTAGTFSLYADGSDLGLDTDGEDIDSLTVLSEGTSVSLLVGFMGSADVTDQVVRDEDLVVLNLTQTGENTVGTWAFEFDGSDVGLNNGGDEDVWGASLNGSTLYLTMRGAFSVSGVSGAQADVLACGSVSNNPTSCQFSLYQDGTPLGIDAERLDGLMVVPASN